MFEKVEIGGATLDASLVGNVLYLSNLQGKDSDMGAVIARVRELSKQYEVYLTLDFSNPRFNQLMDVYTRKGAVPKAILMKVEVWAQQ